MNNEKTFESIRKDNEIYYGTKVEQYFPKIINGINANGIKFIAEILKNAEEVCKRSNRNDGYVKFNLFADRLEIVNNGDLFNDKDVRGICGGIEFGKENFGFMSVYEYTETPEIHSGDFHFVIKNYVHPYEVCNKNNYNVNETLFILPFNNKTLGKKEAYNEIKNFFDNFITNYPAFLKNIKNISWHYENKSGCLEIE